jgi:hypothetical protein
VSMDIVKSVARKKSMRVATVLTGAAALSVTFVQPAEATTLATQPPIMPYKIWVKPGFNESRQQVCGYKSESGVGHWTCTVIQNNNGYPTAPGYDYMGSDWRKGKINVWMWAGSNEIGLTCNTNNVKSFQGFFIGGRQSLELAHSLGSLNPTSLAGPTVGYTGC